MALRQSLITWQFTNRSICLKWFNNPTKFRFKIKLSIIFLYSKWFKIYNKYKFCNQELTLITLQNLVTKTTKTHKKIKSLSKSSKIMQSSLKTLKNLFFFKNSYNWGINVKITKKFYNLLNFSNFSKLKIKIKIKILKIIKYLTSLNKVAKINI
jgi:hypothetical protein